MTGAPRPKTAGRPEPPRPPDRSGDVDVVETVLAWSIPGGTLSVVGVAVYELLRQRGRKRKGTPLATTTVNEITAMFYGSKRMELEHRDSVAVMREEDAQGAPPPRVDLDRGVAVLRPNPDPRTPERGTRGA